MTNPPVNSNFAKSKSQVLLEYVLLAVCLCVIALRTTLTEGLSTQSANRPVSFIDSVYSLTASAALIFSFIIWFAWSICNKKFYYRFTTIEVGLCLFILSGIISGFAAADKRAAITDFVTLLAPVLMAVLLVQILDSQPKLRLLLAVIAALGVVSAYECANQLFVTNQTMIEQYEQAPQSMLGPLDIEPGSLGHFQFEHRLYSKDVRGFFTTSNSAGSFAMLASFAAIALFIKQLKGRKPRGAGLRQVITSGFAVTIVVLGLCFTRSKGAIAASLIAAAMLIMFFLFSDWLRTHKRAILLVCLLLVLSGGCLVVFYGLAHGRLPGGNSMLVRWQYWCASVKMYAEHRFTGVGPGNFASFYPRYKAAEALETVADPHNFLLSILTQYGPAGLIGFLAMIFMPLWRVTSPRTTNSLQKCCRPEPAFKKLAVPFVIVISISLLLIRPIVIPVATGVSFDVLVYVILTLYVAPVVAFTVGFWLLTSQLYAAQATSPKPRAANITAAGLLCACLGFCFHNLIDFAIFEPGVLVTFWAIIACLVSAGSCHNCQQLFVVKLPPFVRMTIVAGVLLIIWVYFSYCLLPVARSSVKIARAHQAKLNGQFRQAHKLLSAAAEDDVLSDSALSLNGRLYLQRFQASEPKQWDLLLQSQKILLAASIRNKADYKNFERLTEVYALLSEISTPQEKTDWLSKAFENGLFAIERYPGCGRLRFELAKIAEQLDKVYIAIEQYQKAVDIEESFRRQFQAMYPSREVISRLGEGKYQFAKQRVKHLREQPIP